MIIIIRMYTAVVTVTLYIIIITEGFFLFLVFFD